MIVGEISSLDNLGDERPKFERLVCRLMVENEVNPADLICLADKESRRGNSSEIENEVCDTSAMTCSRIHSRMSATCTALLR